MERKDGQSILQGLREHQKQRLADCTWRGNCGGTQESGLAVAGAGVKVDKTGCQSPRAPASFPMHPSCPQQMVPVRSSPLPATLDCNPRAEFPWALGVFILSRNQAKPQSPSLRAAVQLGTAPHPESCAHSIPEDTWFCLLRPTCHVHLSTHPPETLSLSLPGQPLQLSRALPLLHPATQHPNLPRHVSW